MRLFKVYIHEIIFLLIYIYFSIKLLINENYGFSFSWGIILILLIFSFIINNPKLKTRIFIFSLLIPITYYYIGFTLEELSIENIDKIIVSIEKKISLDFYKSYKKESLLINEILSIAYVWFFYQMIGSIRYYWKEDMYQFYNFMIGFLFIFSSSYLLYCVAPGSGPLFFEYKNNINIEGYFFTNFLYENYHLFTNQRDAFPSLHTAIIFYILIFDWNHQRFRFILFLIPSSLLLLATIHLGFHYIIDVIFGFIISLIGYFYMSLNGIFRIKKSDEYKCPNHCDLIIVPHNIYCHAHKSNLQQFLHNIHCRVLGCPHAKRGIEKRDNVPILEPSGFIEKQLYKIRKKK